LKQQLNKQKINYKSLEIQLKLLEEDFDLCKQQSERSRILLKEGIISNTILTIPIAFHSKELSVEGARLALQVL